MARTKGKSRGKRKPRKTRKSKVRALYRGGYTPMAMPPPSMGGTFKDVFKTSLGTSLGTVGTIKAIDTVAGLFQKKKSRPKPKAPILKSYDSSSGRYTYG